MQMQQLASVASAIAMQSMQQPATVASDSDSASTCGRWGSNVYDYHLQQIVDADVADVDLRDGWWIRCICCRGRKLKSRQPFSSYSWTKHVQTRTHIDNAAKHSRGNAVHERELLKRTSAGSLRSLRVRRKTLSSQSESQARPSLIESESSSQLRTRSGSDRSGVLVTVIDSLSSLVAEQQDDISELRSKLRAMHDEMATIVTAFRDVHDSQSQLSQSVCSYLKHAAASQSSQLSQPSSQPELPSQSSQAHCLRTRRVASQSSYDTEDTDDSSSSNSTDMSLADDPTWMTEMED